MNLDKAINAMDNNYTVSANTPELKGKPLCISKVSYCYNTGEIEVSVRDKFGNEHEVDIDLIELFPNQNIGTLSVNIDTSEVKDMLNQVEIRKEIAFLLIQNGHVVDKGFKDAVDNVLDAITL